ncbi:hypothetical protein KAI60_04640, partial [Candidatus Bathyarchaeota archaeon]|nr:hypothetical protein [Candidatus Bathyarchaeota archaeon]
QDPKWLIVARNEYRIHTSRIRRIRPYFLYLIAVLLLVYVGFIAPALANLFIEDFLALLLSQAAVGMVQIILFLIFIYFMIIPITQTLKEVQARHLEVFLSAPIKPSDVLLGEFMGQMPFYVIFVTVVTGFFTAALNPLKLGTIQIVIIITIFVFTFLSASWIGNVIAAILRTKLGKTAQGRDIGRALALFIALPLVALIYVIQYAGLFEILADPEKSGIIKALLDLLPSSWGAKVIVEFASNPGNISVIGFESLTRLGGLLIFFISIIVLGIKVTNHVYSLEHTTFTASRARPEGVFYKTIKYIGGGKAFGTLLVTIFKDYSRRLENLSKIAYIVGVIVMTNMFIGRPELSNNSTNGSELGPIIPLLMIQFMLPVLAVFVAGEVTLRGKENLFIYRKTPFGVERFVKAKLMQGWLVVIPIGAIVTAISTGLNPQTTLGSLLSNTG